MDSKIRKTLLSRVLNNLIGSGVINTEQERLNKANSISNQIIEDAYWEGYYKGIKDEKRNLVLALRKSRKNNEVR